MCEREPHAWTRSARVRERAYGRSLQAVDNTSGPWGVNLEAALRLERQWKAGTEQDDKDSRSRTRDEGLVRLSMLSQDGEDDEVDVACERAALMDPVLDVACE